MAEDNPTTSRSSTPRQVARAHAADGFKYGGSDYQAHTPLDLGAGNDAPPAYGTLYNQLNLSQAGFNVGAVVTDDGRININIKQTSRQLADLLAPALRAQLIPSQQKGALQPLPPAYIPPSLGGLPGQEPPPKLNVVIQIVGSRGDVQPFVALGKVLKDTYGHRVRVATHAVFQNFVEENGLEFFAIGGDPAELMAFMVKNPGLMPGIDALKSGEITKRRKGIEQIVLGCWRSCIEAGDGLGPPPEPRQSDEVLVLTDNDFRLAGDPTKKPYVADAIIANPPSFAHIHIAEKMGIPLHMMFTMPWSPTKAFPHPLANIQSSNADEVMTNYVSYALVEMMTWQGLGDVINRFRSKVLDLEPLSLIWAPDWGREINIPGFFFLDLATSYTPEPDLAAFLAAGPPPVYIGFGSIVVDDPNKLTRMIFDAVTASGVRALVSKGWGGLGADSVGIPEGVFMLGNCPHDWLFKKVSCVVHHGGAGTTAAGIKTGTPTVVVPFFGDQPFWGAMIAKAGAGPPPTPYKSLTAEILAESIMTALKPETQARAKELGEKIRQEKGTDLGAKNFHDFLDYDKMRCSVAPSRTAVWRVRKTQVKLSALAASTLVKEGVIRYADLKLYRSQEHDTEEQPWDPISAVIAALVGDVGSMAMAIGDIPRDWYKKAKKAQSQPSDETATASSSHDTGSTTTLTSDTTPTSGMLSPPATSDSASVQGKARPPLSPTGQKASSQSNFDIETALGAGIETGKNLSRVVETGVKTPMNFCMSLAKGFRNAPKLYNDDTVRKQEKVTGLGSGMMLAGREFGLGLYDGITGLATQPIKGAQKEGVSGFFKGFAKGIGGVVLKPQAGFWAIPAYTMKGLHAEVRGKFHRSVENYIVTSRILEGQTDLSDATLQEQKDIVARFKSNGDAAKGLSILKADEREKQKQEQIAANAASISQGTTAAATTDDSQYTGLIPDSPPKTGFWQTKSLSLEERKQLHAQKDAWKKRKAAEAAGTATNSSSITDLSHTPTNLAPEDEEMERAIRESVAQTSHGDPAEDAQIEAQIRASVIEMRRIAAEKRAQERVQVAASSAPQPGEPLRSAQPSNPARTSAEPAVPEDITDEEFDALVAEAARRSMMSHQPGDLTGEERHGVTISIGDEALRQVLAESRRNASSAGTGQNEELDEELRKAIEESERAHREQVARHASERSEEEIIMEYVKKQSLAEEEFRRKGKGPASAVGQRPEEDDEDLKRAMEESLRLSGRQGGPSGSF